AGLMRNQAHAQDRLRVLLQLLPAARDLHAPALAASAGMDLGLDHPDRSAQLAASFHRLLQSEASYAARSGFPVPAQDVLGLVFVDLHARMIGLVAGLGLTGSMPRPAGTEYTSSPLQAPQEVPVTSRPLPGRTAGSGARSLTNASSSARGCR